MQRKMGGNLLLLVLLFSFFIVLGKHKIISLSQMNRLNEKTVTSEEFRKQQLDKGVLSVLEKEENKGKIAGLYLLESRFSEQNFSEKNKRNTYKQLYMKWAVNKEWTEYHKVCKAICTDLK